MPRKKTIEDYVTPRRVPKNDFMAMVKKVPTYYFCQMAAKAGLPPAEARELCQAFMDLKK